MSPRSKVKRVSPAWSQTRRRMAILSARSIRCPSATEQVQMSCGSAPFPSGPEAQAARRAYEGVDDRASPRGVRDAVATACERGAVLAHQLRIAVLTRMRRRQRTRKLLGGCRRRHQGGRHDQADQHESESHVCSLPRRPVGAGRRVFVGVPSRTSSEPPPPRRYRGPPRAAGQAPEMRP